MSENRASRPLAQGSSLIDNFNMYRPLENNITTPTGPPIPKDLCLVVDSHKKWKKIVEDAQKVIEADADIQHSASKGMYLKERALPPQVVGRTYAEYCTLVNRMYEAYVNSVQLQRAQYMKHIVSVFMKRMYELRRELVHLILTDYIYVDASLVQLHLTPQDIEIVVPCHIPAQARPDSIEELLQTMWTEAWERKNAPPPAPSVQEHESFLMAFVDSTTAVEKKESVHTELTEEYLTIRVIQAAERHRQWYMRDFKNKCNTRRTYFAEATRAASDRMKHKAATFVQRVIREYMMVKRVRVRDYKRNVFMGIVADPWRPHLDEDEETRKLYNRRRKVNEKARQLYEKEMEYVKNKIYLLKKDDQMEDITAEIREWFREWYLGYGFFPEYPYPLEGGTIIVVRGDYPTIEEKIEDDDLNKKANAKKLTKEQIKAEKKQAQIDAQLKAEAEKEDAKKAYLQELRVKANPFGDPGYKVQQSTNMGSLTEVLQNYLASWSIYDNFPAKENGDVVYGYMQELLTEELMSQLHVECRELVDELLRLELKTLIAAQQADFKEAGKPFPKVKPRKKPKEVLPPVPYEMSETIKEDVAGVFDLEIVSKPTARIRDIIGDSNYGAYEANIVDPSATFPPPGYGDIRNRLKLSCVFGAGVAPGAVRNKAVLLLGQPKNGKSFLVDCVAGELNAVKIDISPEVFSGKVRKPGELLGQAFAAARAFQPSVIFLKNVERVFKTKLSAEERRLRVKSIKKVLVKGVKGIGEGEQIIFIATCSSISGYRPRPVMSMFSEIILVPRPNYGSVRDFFYYKFQSMRSMERDYCVQPLAQTLQGFGFGTLIEAFNTILNADRIVKLNAKPLDPLEFINYMIDAEKEPLTLEEFEAFQNFYLKFSSLKTPRADYANINRSRAINYKKMEKKMAAAEAAEEAAED